MPRAISLLFALFAVAFLGQTQVADARLVAKRDGAKATSLRLAQPELLPPTGPATVGPAIAGSTPCITYRNRGCVDVCCGCEAPIEAVLLVKDPVTCCCVEVPVCLPPCCSDEPKVCGREGLFGRGIVDYEWCCGFSVKVTFRARGDIVVTYVGR
jgi:hypothetical protein